MLDVHTFDRKLVRLDIPKYPLEVKREAFSTESEEVKQLFQNLEEYDEINDYVPSDILMFILEGLSQNEGLLQVSQPGSLRPLLNEQISDIANLGRCSQGKTVRLISIAMLLAKPVEALSNQ